MEAPNRDPDAPRRLLPFSMLVLGATGHLAWVYLAHDGRRAPYSSAWLPGLVWLSTVSIACWAVLLVRPGMRRIVVGVLASIAAIAFVYVSDRAATRWFSARGAPPATVLRTDRVPGRGEPFVLPSGLVDVDGNALDLPAYGDRPLLI